MANDFDKNELDKNKNEEMTNEEREEIIRRIAHVDFDDDDESYAEEIVYGDSEDDIVNHGVETEEEIKEINLEDYAKDVGGENIIEMLKSGSGKGYFRVKKSKAKQSYVTKNKEVKKLWRMANIEEAEKELARGTDIIEFTGKYENTDIRKIKYLPIHIFAFAIPFILMMTAFAAIGLYPFGGRQIMIIDSWHQYFPFLQELQAKLLSGESILYSWNGGGGTNFLTLMSYYASTPLYLLSVLSPAEYLREFMMIITAVKIGFAGLFFSIYLRGMYNHDYLSKDGDLKYNKKHCTSSVGLAILGFSVLYALCAYVTGYYWCLFFLDNVALLPLIMLGLERLIDSGKFKLYAITLGIAVIANHYTAMFVCIFILLYYFIIYFVKLNKKFNFGEFFKTSFKVLAASLIGLGLAACILLPTFYWFGNTGNSNSTFGRDVDTYSSLIDIFTGLLSGGAPNIRAMTPEGLPNIACGLACVIFAGLYFINKNIKLKDRLLFGGFLIALAVCFNLNILDYIWHVGHFPNEIPFRQSFVFSFVLVTVAFKSYIAFKSGNKSVNFKTLGMFGLGLFAFILVAEKLYKGTNRFSFEIFYISGALLAVYMLILLLFKYKRLSVNMLAVFMMFIMLFEGGMSAVKGAATAGSSDRATYPIATDAIRGTVDYIYENDPELYRLEMAKWFGTNDPMLYGYRGVSQFSSEANGRFTYMLEKLGIKAHPGGNKYLYSSATPVANMFLSIKYLMTRKGHSFLNSAAFDQYYEYYDYNDENESANDKAEVTAYKNKYWLPIAFMVSENINEANLNVANPFIVQNDIMKKAAGIHSDIFRSIYPKHENVGNVNVNVTPSNYGVYNYSTVNAEKGTVNQRYSINETQQVYIYLKNPWYGGDKKNATVRLYYPNGEKYPEDITSEVDNGATIDCGIIQAGGEIEVSFDVRNGSATYYLYVSSFDEDTFCDAYNILSDNVMQVSEFSDTRIKGTITADEDGLFFASIPYEKGWHVKVNGVERAVNPPSEAELRNVNLEQASDEETEKEDPRIVKTMRDGFITIPLQAGTHEIELYYVTDGLVPGITISLICIGLLICWGILSRIYKLRLNKKIKENKESEEYI